MRTTTVILALALCAVGAMAGPEDGPLRQVSTSAANFATSFVKTVSGQNKGMNLISSPLSAHIVLSMAAYGATDETAEEMRRALQLPKDDTAARQGFQDLIVQLNNVKKVVLEVANKMYLANNLILKEKFKELTARNFRSEVAQINIDQPAESVGLINGWVKEKTHNKIMEIVKPDDITADTRMVLLNAIYFKGNWARPFNKESTTDMVFHLDETKQKMVPTMFSDTEYFYGELPDLKAKFIELPYENKDLKMVIIVPDEINGLSSILENLESFNQTRLATAGMMREIQLYLPKFKIESTIDLQSPLEMMGMRTMFTDAAKFSGITDVPLKVTKVLQKAFIEVNEEGSEAAAATAIKIQPLSLIPEPELTVDRPFLFSIVDKRTNVSLFNGQVVHPKSE